MTIHAVMAVLAKGPRRRPFPLIALLCTVGLVLPLVGAAGASTAPSSAVRVPTARPSIGAQSLLSAARHSLAQGQGPAVSASSDANWTQAIIESSGSYPAMAYDPALGAVVLFQGLSGAQANSTWTYSGGRWTELHLSASPPPRYAETMVYDTTDQELILFGGVSSTGGYLNDTWAFARGAWTQVNTTATGAPPAREFPSATDDPAVDGVVLFGGTNAYWYSYQCLGQTFQDTWVFSAGAWSEVNLSGGSAPPVRYGASLAYDPGTNTTVLFGGADYLCTTNSTRVYNDTWSFNGTAWTSVGGSGSPSARLLAGLAPSSLDDSLILAGGSTGGIPFYIGSGPKNDTWRWANGTWQSVGVPGPPPSDGDNPLVALPNGSLLLFGVPLWLFNGTEWALTGPAPLPPATWSPLLAYDRSDGYVVLYGGPGGSYGPGITWEFRNGTWTDLTRPGAPSPPTGNGDVMADDPGDGYVVLFAGGSNATWGFRGGTWTQFTSSDAPSPRWGAALTYDPADGYLLLFGGSDCALNSWWVGCVWNNDTWAFSGGNWSLLPSSGSTGPSGRSYASMAFDPADGTVVMFGGVHCTTGQEDCAPLNDTWTYRAGQWTRSSGSRAPSPRAEAAMTYDESNASLVLFGGTSVGSTYAPDGIQPGLWRFSAGTWSNVTVAPNTFTPGASAAAAFAYVPDLGRDLLYQWSGNAWLLRLDPLVTNLSVAVTSEGLIGDAPFTVHFVASASGGRPPYSFSWQFGDGGAGASSTMSHEYLSPGSYTAVLRVFDSGGNESARSFAVVVAPPPSVADSTSTDSGPAPLTLQVGAVVQGGIPPFAAVWSFGDGSDALVLNASHTYYAPGNYTLNLTVTDSAGTVAWGQPRTLQVGPPSAALEVSLQVAPVSIILGSAVTLTAVTSGGTTPFTFVWTGLPPGCTGANSSSETCTPTAVGTFSPVVTVTDSTGTGQSTSGTVVVSPPALDLRLTIDPEPALLGDPISVVANVSGGVSPLNSTWTGLPPGCVPTGPFSEVCRPPTAGTYNLSLTVRDGAGQSEGTTSTMVVLPAPVATAPGVGVPPVEVFALGAVLGAGTAAFVYVARVRTKKQVGKPDARVAGRTDAG